MYPSFFEGYDTQRKNKSCKKGCEKNLPLKKRKLVRMLRFTLKTYPYKSKLGCIGNLLGKYAIYGLSQSASAPRFNLGIFMNPKYIQ